MLNKNNIENTKNPEKNLNIILNYSDGNDFNVDVMQVKGDHFLMVASSEGAWFGACSNNNVMAMGKFEDVVETSKKFMERSRSVGEIPDILDAELVNKRLGKRDINNLNGKALKMKSMNEFPYVTENDDYTVAACKFGNTVYAQDGENGYFESNKKEYMKFLNQKLEEWNGHGEIVDPREQDISIE